MNHFIIHIGLPKTATSSLQQYLFANRNHLGDQGCLYPLTCEWHDKSHHKLVFALQEPKAPASIEGKNKVTLDLANEISQANCKECIISSELLANRPSQEILEQILNTGGPERKHVFILNSFRNLPDLYLSNFFQRIRDPAIALNLSLTDWINKRLVLAELENSLLWQQLGGQQSRHRLWFRYEVQKSSNKVPFLKYFSRRYRLDCKNIPHKNSSISLASLVILHHINSTEDLTLQQKRQVRKIVARREFNDMARKDSRLCEIGQQYRIGLNVDQCHTVRHQLFSSAANDILRLILDRKSYKELARANVGEASYDQVFLENYCDVKLISNRVLNSVS